MQGKGERKESAKKGMKKVLPGGDGNKKYPQIMPYHVFRPPITSTFKNFQFMPAKYLSNVNL